ncbi:hypothetical protein BSPWISOXPB_1542 [uncultured Gammaproteobacteria bacterium]|nr:hypothetical protein BSPWISOXPB_1542 [uncultured Gammaproteobacteria bacterium]
MQAKTQTLKMTIVSGLRIIDSNAQTGISGGTGQIIDLGNAWGARPHLRSLPR